MIGERATLDSILAHDWCMVKQKPVVILGGGPAGLSAAYYLTGRHRDSFVFEKESIVGGLARTLKFGKFYTDIGPHVFYSKKAEVYNWFLTLLKGKAHLVKKISRFYVDGKYFLYPVNLKNALTGVGILKATRMVGDYVLEKIKRMLFKKKLASFEDYAISNFGRTLANFNILNYTRKSWGMSCTKISPYLAQLRIKNISLTSTLKSIIFKAWETTNETLQKFYYPDLGAGVLYDELKKKIEAGKGNRVFVDSKAVGIVHDNKKVTAVLISRK